MKKKVAPWSALFSAQSRPPWASMIDRLIENPIPKPSRLVVKKGWNILSSLSLVKPVDAPYTEESIVSS
jgi:hypothetical protein